MGLDMYLTKKLYIWKNARGKLQIKGLPVRVNSKELKQIEAEAGYWRKANQIHKWFVDNVQEGVDDCGSYYVSRDQLLELLLTVEKVLKTIKLVDGQIVQSYTFNEKGEKIAKLVKGKVIKDTSLAEALLPAQSGFFFGGTDYDEYYVSDLKETQKILKKALKAPKDWLFYYQSSW